MSGSFGTPPGTRWLQQQRDAALAAKGEAGTRAIPYGPLKVKQMRLLPQYSDLGKTRPFGPGEAVQLPDGSITSEESYTVQLPNGKWAVIPGLWLVNGVPTKMTEDQATQLAVSSGLAWPNSFDTSKEADAYANQREATWEKIPEAMDMTTQQPALWARQPPGPGP